MFNWDVIERKKGRKKSVRDGVDEENLKAQEK